MEDTTGERRRRENSTRLSGLWETKTEGKRDSVVIRRSYQLLELKLNRSTETETTRRMHNGSNAKEKKKN